MSLQLYAAIKKSSKYFGQTAPGEAFPVNSVSNDPCGYVINGGPGGHYRLADVHLYARSPAGELVGISRGATKPKAVRS